MVRNKKMLLICLLLAVALVFTGCGSKTTTPSTTPADDSPAATEQGGDLIIAVLSDAVALDPHGSNDVPSSNVAYNIYESLVVLDQNSVIQPLLATSWKSVDDLTWEFALRQGVKFHDGTDFNAEVVKANFDRLLDPDVASPRLFLFEMITDVIVVNDYTVQIKTEYPFAPLLAHLAHSGGAMISAEAIAADYKEMQAGKKAGAYISTNPVGTGYFQFDNWVPGEQIKLVRNENYWGDKAKLDSVTFKVVPENLTRVSELETGYAHVADPILASDMARVDGFPIASLFRKSSTSLAYLGFNTAKAPFDNVKVRQAISMAVNKDDIVKGVYHGTGLAAVGPIAPGVFGYDPTVTPMPYDVAKAKELLTEAGFPNGFQTTLWTNDNPARVQIAEYVQSKLKDIGITVKIEIVEWGAYLKNTANGEHDMFILGWSTPTLDGDYAMYALFHSSQHGSAGNRTFFSNDELDALLEKGRKETNAELRKKYYREAQELLVDLAPMLYIWHQEYLTGVNNQVKNFDMTPGQIFLLQNVYIEK